MKILINKTRIPSNVSFFDKILEIEIEKEDLFKLGIFKHEVPSIHVCESDYLYLESKISAYIKLYDDFIVIDGDSIINISKDDRVMKDISEIIGIALGIKISIESFEIRQETISKIPPPNKKEKYLDYKFLYNNSYIEFETKGTISKSISRFVKDITDKKANKDETSFRFGTVAVITNSKKSHETIIHLCDDPPEDVSQVINRDNIPLHYLGILECILDNKYYNQLMKENFFKKGKNKKLIKIKEKFFGQYSFDGDIYFGEFFDRRLNLESIRSILTPNDYNINKIFKKITKMQGRRKFFIGIHSEIIKLLLQKRGLEEILKLEFSRINKMTETGVNILRDSDGVIIVMTTENNDPQVASQFQESEVKKRIGRLINLELHRPSRCGSPCRSKEKKGKSCEILTYRGACHFHR